MRVYASYTAVSRRCWKVSVIDISPRHLGSMCFVFDSISTHADDDTFLSGLFERTFDNDLPNQYIFESSPNFSDTDALCMKLIEDLRKGVREKRFAQTSGRFTFAIYEDLCHLTMERIEKVLSFCTQSLIELGQGGGYIESHLFCVFNDTGVRDERQQALNNMRQAVDFIRSQDDTINIKVYLVVPPRLLESSDYLDATVRWVYLNTRAQRPEIFRNISSSMFFNITYAGYHVEGCAENRKIEKNMLDRLGVYNDDFERDTNDIKELKKKMSDNFNKVVNECSNHAMTKATEINRSIVDGVPIHENAYYSIKSRFCKKKKEERRLALSQLSVALEDTYHCAVHIPLFLNAISKMHGDDKLALPKAIFHGLPLVSILASGEKALKELVSDIASKNKSSNRPKPEMESPKLKSDMNKQLTYFLEESVAQLPVILSVALMRVLSDQMINYEREKIECIEKLNEARHNIEIMGGKRFDEDVMFIQQAKRVTEESEAILHDGALAVYEMLIVSRLLKERWDILQSNVEYNQIYYLGENQNEADYNVLQAFRVVGFDLSSNAVREQMFRL